MTETTSLSLAICEYDHVRDLMDGTVRPAGIALNIQTLPAPEIFARFTRFREWDVSEMSLGMYVSLLSQGDTSLTAIPVYPSRMFRQSAFFVRRDGPVRAANDLIGARIGFPDWAHTAGIYARGFLSRTCGVPLDGIRWVQGGVNAPGHATSVEVKWPEGFDVTSVADRSLDEMLVAGDTGNDRSMFDLPDVRGIVVGNALPELRAIGEGNPRVFNARRTHAAGVLEGLVHWSVLEREGI